MLLLLLVAGGLPVRLMRVASGSMAPTLETGDLVLVVPAGSVARGDVVVVTDPRGGPSLVKRVAGVAGDVVAIEDGLLVVNGGTVCEPQVDQSRVDGVYFGPVTVPDGALFLLGDARGDSIDSRAFGPVPTRAVVGRVQTQVWPSPGGVSAPAGRC